MTTVTNEHDGTETAPTGASTDAPTEAPSRPSRFWLWTPWILAVLALLAAGYSTWQWQVLAGEEADRAAVQAAASDFMLTLTNWDARDGLDDTVDELRAAGSEQFLEEIDELFGGSLRQELEQARAVSTGEIQDVFVQSVDDREAVVFAVVIQELEVGLTDESSATVRSARIALRRADDRWLVTRVELVNDSGFGGEGDQ